jgi:TonB family protein
MPGKRKSIPRKIQVRLFMEVNLQCPFCRNKDADHFEIHHIDGNTEDNIFQNLLMVCPTCHSKITKGDYTQQEVISMKQLLSIQKNEEYPFEKEEVESQFPGGDTVFHEFLQKNLRYPQEAVDKEISGTVIVQFVVDQAGVLKDVEALTGPIELRSEAVRVIQKSAHWLPARQNGRFVKSYKKQPIVFKLDQEKDLLQRLLEAVLS